MDKNFIDIDSLVKQRLGGGEETGNAGSWQNMRDLLDREMPRQQPGNGFLKGRYFGAAVVLLLAGAVGTGTYKLATAPGNTISDKFAALTGGSSPAQQNNSSATGANSTAHYTPATGSGVVVSTSSGATNDAAGAYTENSHPAANNTAIAPAAQSDAGASGSANNIGGNPSAGSAGRNGGTPGVYTPSGNASAGSLSRGGNTSAMPAAGNTAGNNRNAVAGSNSVTGAATRMSGDVAAVPAKNNNAGNKRNANVASANINKPGNSADSRAVSADKMALGSGAANGDGVPVFVTKTGKRIPGDKLQRMNTGKTRQNPQSANNINANALRNKRVIQRMRLVERFIKTSATGEGFYQMDTLSVVTLTEELGVITETKVNVPKQGGK